MPFLCVASAAKTEILSLALWTSLLFANSMDRWIREGDVA
jgi:hypothetical protein